jgi:hypothetical protein
VIEVDPRAASAGQDLGRTAARHCRGSGFDRGGFRLTERSFLLDIAA